MNRSGLLGVLLAPFFIGAAHAQSWMSYDTFSGGSISPVKWSTAQPSCLTASTFDCERRVENKELALEITTYGSRATSAGINYDNVGLTLPNFANYKGFSAQTVFNTFVSTGCAANPSYTHPQFLLYGDYFNTGSHKYSDDVAAYLIAEHPSGGAAGISVGAFLGYQGGFFGNIFFGQYKLGTVDTFSIYWNRAQSRFDFTVNGVTKSIPYTWADASAAASPVGGIGIRNFVANCQATPTEAAMLATISGVSVSK